MGIFEFADHASVFIRSVLSQAQSTTPFTTTLRYVAKTVANMDHTSLTVCTGIAATCRGCYSFFATLGRAGAEATVRLRKLQTQRSILYSEHRASIGNITTEAAKSRNSLTFTPWTACYWEYLWEGLDYTVTAERKHSTRNDWNYN